MANLKELINELCPNGVEHEMLRDIADFTNGKGHEKVVEENGKYILVTSKAISSNMEQVRRTNKILTPLKKNDITMVMSDLPNGKALAKCFIIDEDEKYTLNQRVCGLRVKDLNRVSPKFLYYILNRNIQLLKYDNGVDQTNLKKDDILNINIAIPPMEIQLEIVYILDKFAELSIELSLELKARQQQFAYYREELYNKNDNIQKLEDIVDIRLGLTHTPKYVDEGIKFISAQNTSNDYLNLENVKYISQEEYDSITENAKPKRGDILFTRVGSNLGHPVIVETDEELCMFVSLGYLRVKDKNKVLNTYIKHWLNTENFWSQVRKNVHGSAKVNLNTGWLSKFEISIPSIEEQQKVVNILEKLDKLCNNIFEGLPAEIEARQKQAEYYRDKLLSFKEVEVNE